ncbi:hypothetical protein BDW22DRAFT_1432294 [Trametopsis cervina]|nr:hypothetical protein BDW22DRAFT_1432294 [Trametopsis cervina]
MSRSQHEPTVSSQPTPKSSSQSSSPIEFEQRAGPQATTEPSSASPQSPQQDSSTSEGYPSWLPKRPPPPGPRSTIHSSSALGMFNEAGPSNEPFVGGRRPTPRSVRIVSLQNSLYGEKEQQQHPRRESTDPSRLYSGAHNRVWSRATSAGRSTTLFSSGAAVPRPRFRSASLHAELLRNPSWKMRIWYYLFPLFVFSHIPLQTFFDFNVAFILLLVAKHPNPAAPGVPGSGRNWSLGAAAYIACWVTQVFVVFVMYELVYSFIRRWRVKRPLMLPIYFSSPAFNLTAMTSYTNFCFLYHIRASAFLPEHGGFRDGLAETFYYYSQNLPTVALLLPRAALSLALLLSFWTPQASELAQADAGVGLRDGTYFRSSDQTLTDYARGVLIANAAWTAWRLLVLLVSWTGLWAISGHGCAGLCGPRFRWEEEDAEKTVTTLSQDNFIQGDSLPWTWREHTLLRVIDTYEFCLTNKHPRMNSGSGPKKDYLGVDTPTGTAPFDGIEKVFAAIGLGQERHAARRGVLSGDLFESPQVVDMQVDDHDLDTGASSIEPPLPVVIQREREAAAPSGPLEKLPYPFTGSRSQVSSQDPIPFPPSPEPEQHKEVTTSDEVEEGDDDDDEEEEEEEEDDESHSGDVESSEVVSDDRRTSGSMSSLGRPVVSRYPFSFRRPTSGRASLSSTSQLSPHQVSTPPSQQTHSTPSRSGQSTRVSQSTQSTGNRESSDSPLSHPSSSNGPSPVGLTGSVIPMPPRHPHRRARAGTVPIPMSSPSSQSSTSPVVFPGRHARARADSARTRTESDMSMTFGPIPMAFVLDSDEEEGPMHDDSLMDVPEAEGSVEEAEQQDSVGLLSPGTSPRASRTSLRQFASGLQRRANGSRSRSGTASRSRTSSSNSRSDSARSRAQSLIQSLSAASRSSGDVRSRANSMARLSDSPYYSTSPDPTPSSPENNTFGHPRRGWRTEISGMQEDDVSDIAELPERTSSETESILGEELLMPAIARRERLASEISRIAPSERSGQTERPATSAPTVVDTAPEGPSSPLPAPASPTSPVPIPGRVVHTEESMPDISTADQSFVTAPATIQGTTDSSGRTPEAGWDANQARIHPMHGGATWEPA